MTTLLRKTIRAELQLFLGDWLSELPEEAWIFDDHSGNFVATKSAGSRAILHLDQMVDMVLNSVFYATFKELGLEKEFAMAAKRTQRPGLEVKIAPRTAAQIRGFRGHLTAAIRASDDGATAKLDLSTARALREICLQCEAYQKAQEEAK